MVWKRNLTTAATARVVHVHETAMPVRTTARRGAANAPHLATAIGAVTAKTATGE